MRNICVSAFSYTEAILDPVVNFIFFKNVTSYRSFFIVAFFMDGFLYDCIFKRIVAPDLKKRLVRPLRGNSSILRYQGHVQYDIRVEKLNHMQLIQGISSDQRLKLQFLCRTKGSIRQSL